jgi:hypothetical protein
MPCEMGEINQWLHDGDDCKYWEACLLSTVCWECTPCMVEDQRTRTEARIQRFHVTRGDEYAKTFNPIQPHEWLCQYSWMYILAPLWGLGAVLVQHKSAVENAKNVQVKRRFESIHGAGAGAIAPPPQQAMNRA